jgi:N-acetyl-anhydromuramyl-L-alanine amidase AmpD
VKSSSRNGAKVRLIAVHTTEGIKKVTDLRAFFDRADAGGSSHAAADNTGALHGPDKGYVPYDRAAWTLRSGNPISDNLEYCGWAKTTRAQWLSDEAKGLEAIAQWVAERCRARGIPPVKLTPAEVKAGKSGVIGHTDWTTGMNDGTHWDPGPGFPWDVVMARVKQIIDGDEEFSVAAADEIKALIKGYGGRTENTERMVADIQAKTVGYGRRTENAERDARIAAAGVADLNQKLVGYGNRIENTEARVVALEAAVKAMAPGVNLSEEQVGEAVAKALRDNVVKVAVDVAGSVK